MQAYLLLSVCFVVPSIGNLLHLPDDEPARGYTLYLLYMQCLGQNEKQVNMILAIVDMNIY